jgi:cation diffusion facilitator CzcD-associated flavoprotein CzcO
MPSAAKWTLSKIPGAGRVARALSQSLVELAFPIAAHYHRTLPVAGMVEKQARAYLKAEVEDPVLRDKLTPRYPLGCKRPSFHNEYLQAFNRDDVLLETTSIAHIEPDAVVMSDGTRHEIDVLVLATGFKVFETGNMPPFPVSGRDGVDLEDFWTENRFQAYEGASVPGFPNFFTILGPYAYNGASYFNLIETQTRHIVRCLKRARRDGATMIEVTQEANDRFFEQMLSRRGNQIFFQGTCSTANSYYFDQHGDVPFRPSPSLEVAVRSARFDLDDYRFAA